MPARRAACSARSGSPPPSAARDARAPVLLRGEALTDDATLARAAPASADEVALRRRATAASRTSCRCATSRRDAAALREAFAAAHEERYGYRDDGAEVELVTVRTARVEPGAEVAWATEHAATLRSPGPAVVALPEATLVVPEGWRGRHRRRPAR